MASTRGKKSGQRRKVTGPSATNAGTTRKNSGAAGKNAAPQSSSAGRRRSNAPEGSALAEADTLSRPKLAAVPLEPRERSGRTVENVDLALKNAEVRLKLAWKYRGLLDVALPPQFHAVAWTALDRLRSGRERDAVIGSGDGSPLGELARKLSTLRAIVEDTTRPGDPAREALGFGVPIKATRALPAEARAIVRGARQVRSRFPALTEQLLGDAESSITIAAQHVKGAHRAEVDRAARRADTADESQIALDVLLDCVDHLRAAARSTLADVRPRLAETLTAPLEASRSREPAAPATPEQPVPES